MATNTVALMRDGDRLLHDLAPQREKRIMAVLAEAGCGKSELAAQLTAAVGDRPSGVLIHGRDLNASQNLDDLARSVAIAGKPVPDMGALLAAVDSAGQRARRRLPIVIDGLNEAEDPRNWKRFLASLEVTLSPYRTSLLFVRCARRSKTRVCPPGSTD